MNIDNFSVRLGPDLPYTISEMAYTQYKDSVLVVGGLCTPEGWKSKMSLLVILRCAIHLSQDVVELYTGLILPLRVGSPLIKCWTKRGVAMLHSLWEEMSVIGDAKKYKFQWTMDKVLRPTLGFARRHT